MHVLFFVCLVFESLLRRVQRACTQMHDKTCHQAYVHVWVLDAIMCVVIQDTKFSFSTNITLL